MSKFTIDKGEIQTDATYESANTRTHNGVEYVTVEWACRYHGVTVQTVNQWVREKGLTAYQPQGRRRWLRKDEVQAFTRPTGVRRPRLSPEAKAVALRADLTEGEAAFLSGLTVSQVHCARRDWWQR